MKQYGVIITRTLQTAVQKFGRFITVKKQGKSDVVEAVNVTPYGFDSNPIKNMVAIYADSTKLGESVILGYVSKSLLAELGESRMFSTDANGNLKMFVWCKNDGSLQLGGTANHLATFEKLKAGFDQLVQDHNALVDKWNSFVAAYAPGGPSIVGTPATLSGSHIDDSTAKIDDAKITNITTP